MRKMAGLSLMSTNSKTCGVVVWTGLGGAGVDTETGGGMELEAFRCRVSESDSCDPVSDREVAGDEG